MEQDSPTTGEDGTPRTAPISDRDLELIERRVRSAIERGRYMRASLWLALAIALATGAYRYIIKPEIQRAAEQAIAEQIKPDEAIQAAAIAATFGRLTQELIGLSDDDRVRGLEILKEITDLPGYHKNGDVLALRREPRLSPTFRDLVADNSQIVFLVMTHLFDIYAPEMWKCRSHIEWLAYRYLEGTVASDDQLLHLYDRYLPCAELYKPDEQTAYALSLHLLAEFKRNGLVRSRLIDTKLRVLSDSKVFQELILVMDPDQERLYPGEHIVVIQKQFWKEYGALLDELGKKPKEPGT